jgi:hypothetical protein
MPVRLNPLWVAERQATQILPPPAVTNGQDLTPAMTGPWAVQNVAQGSETLGSSLTGPPRGFWRFDTTSEFVPAGVWPASASDSNLSALNNPSLHGGTVTGSPVQIDGYTIPAGTQIVQFQIFPDGFDFDAQLTSLVVLFRGCRFRFTQGLGGTGLFNDFNSTSGQQIMVHYCDIGMTTLDPPATAPGNMIIKNLGGLNHRYLRNFHTRSGTFYQPNTQGVSIIENYIDEYIYTYGEAGVDGAGPDASTLHLNGSSSEGGITSIKILRNRITCPSPDGSTGSTGSAAAQIGYGTQPGQLGYGAGSNPGRLTTQTDNIALFSSNALPNQGTSPGAIQVSDNYIGGSGYCLYAGNALGNCTNITVTGNRVTTRWWPNGGNFGPITDVPAFGTNGNVTGGNIWADDYGTAVNPGSTALADRQYPAGNGPRAGTAVF